MRFLILCEGKETEPNYFRTLYTQKQSDIIIADIEGLGRSTCSLVKYAVRLRKQMEAQKQLDYDRVWVMFDKDDFPDFDQAIILCRDLGYGAAWSNQSFELWYLLHFQYITSDISRKAYIKKLEEIIRNKSGDNKFKYDKADKQLLVLMQKYGDHELAKRHAEKLREIHRHKNSYNLHAPCTTVDLLVKELENPESLLDK